MRMQSTVTPEQYHHSGAELTIETCMSVYAFYANACRTSSLPHNPNVPMKVCLPACRSAGKKIMRMRIQVSRYCTRANLSSNSNNSSMQSIGLSSATLEPSRKRLTKRLTKRHTACISISMPSLITIAGLTTLSPRTPALEKSLNALFTVQAQLSSRTLPL